MKKQIIGSSFLLLLLLINGCDNKPKQSNDSTPKKNEIAIGTDINSIVKSQEDTINKLKNDADSEKSEYQELSWKDLEPPGNGAAEIVIKYEKEIEEIPEGSLKEKEVLERMQADLNSIPVNETLDKKKIKIPGFVSPLEIDEKQGVVKEFLLVPYFGACIHVPPPPMNMTLLVKLPKEQQIKLDDSYQPVWVSGVIHAESTFTELAEAGYKITDVKIEPYTEEIRPR